MKKGIIGAVIGFLAFFVALFVIFMMPGDGGIIFFILFGILFILAFLFIIFVAIKAIQQSKLNSPYRSDKNYEGTNNLKPCVDCNQLIDIDFEYCPKCGASQKNTIICEYCGHENPASNALCEKCNGFL